MPPRLRLAVIAAAALLLAPSTAAAFNPAVEAQNFSKGNERSAIYNTPEYRALLAQVSAQNSAAAVAIQASDPERQFHGQLCENGTDGCAGDARLYDWQAKGYGIVEPVLFTARNGATISGKVWATREGPAKRPGIVITNGSVQAPEQLYWFVAQVLAKAGYVVLTSDPQNQGQSDSRGEAPDQNEGFPAQSDGRPFFDGTEDAINFFLSTSAHPYTPVKSCETGTSHAAKQNRRVAAGLNKHAYNPFYSLLDPGRLGIAGHSYGASGVSYIGQADPRVDAIVALDNLGDADPNGSGVGSAKPCPSDPSARTPAPLTKPALGMSADYFIPPTPNASDPDPLAKSVQSREYSAKNLDTGELIIRGGTHYDFDWIPNQGFPATLRGADMIDWYTTAWFDRYVKGDAGAERRLRTDRWRRDQQEGAVDPNHDPNLFSFYYRSRLDIGRSGPQRFTCEDLRPGCAGLTAEDGFNGNYDFLSIARSPDKPGAGDALAVRSQGLGVCTSRRRIAIHVKRVRGVRIRTVAAYVGKRRVGRGKGRAVVVRLTGLPRQAARVTLKVSGRRHGRTVRLVRHRTYHTCQRRRRG